MTTLILPLTEDRFDIFVELINGLAIYEELAPPDDAAIERLRNDAFGVNKRYMAFIAMQDTTPVGYAIAFETYSSFLAKPTMYLEDLFVMEQYRNTGAGSALFNHVRALAEERGCGRMDWQVLEWNKLAQDFYTRKGVEYMEGWMGCRITL